MIKNVNSDGNMLTIMGFAECWLANEEQSNCILSFTH